jgi:hypothetical protein
MNLNITMSLCIVLDFIVLAPTIGDSMKTYGWSLVSIPKVYNQYSKNNQIHRNLKP